LSPLPCSLVTLALPACVCMGLSIETVPNVRDRHGQEVTHMQRWTTSHRTAPLARPSNCTTGLRCGSQVPVAAQPQVPQLSKPSHLAQGRCSSSSRNAVHSQLLAQPTQGCALKRLLAQPTQGCALKRPRSLEAALAQGRLSLTEPRELKAASPGRSRPLGS
jgi:hypothetical protein